MVAGTWILSYLEFDNLENHYRDALQEVRVELLVESEKEALDVAWLLWQEHLAKGTYTSWASKVGYDKNELYPAQPRVIYEILLA